MSKIAIIVGELGFLPSHEFALMSLLKQGHGVLLIKSDGGRVADQWWFDECQKLDISKVIITSSLLPISPALGYCVETQAKHEAEELRKILIGDVDLNSSAQKISDMELPKIIPYISKESEPYSKLYDDLKTRQNYKGDLHAVSKRNLRRQKK